MPAIKAWLRVDPEEYLTTPCGTYPFLVDQDEVPS